MCHHPHLRQLEQLLPAYLRSARAPNTVSKYEGYYKSWCTWAKTFPEITVLPAKDREVGLFLISKLQGGKSVHVISSIVYAIKWYHLINGLDDPTGTICGYLIESAKRVAKPKRTRKEPLTTDNLKSIFHVIGGKHASLLDFRRFTLLLLSFAGFLRFSEAVNLRRGDLKFFSTHMTLFLESSKTDQYRDGHTLLISGLPSQICPVAITAGFLKRLRLQHKHDAFIFRAMFWHRRSRVHKLKTSNKPISYSTARRDTLTLVKRIGLNPKKFGLHSARSGGATAAANKGVPDRLFKRHGRWLSDKAKDAYVKDSFHKLLSVTQNLGL